MVAVSSRLGASPPQCSFEMPLCNNVDRAICGILPDSPEPIGLESVIAIDSQEPGGRGAIVAPKSGEIAPIV